MILGLKKGLPPKIVSEFPSTPDSRFAKESITIILFFFKILQTACNLVTSRHILNHLPISMDLKQHVQKILKYLFSISFLLPSVYWERHKLWVILHKILDLFWMCKTFVIMLNNTKVHRFTLAYYFWNNTYMQYARHKWREKNLKK